MRLLLEELLRERADLALQTKLREEVAGKIGEAQRDYVLRQMLEAVRKELGEETDEAREVAELRKRLEQAELPEEAAKEAERELDRLQHIPAASPEHAVARSYLDWLVALPWSRSSEGTVEIERAKQILDQDHFGLEKVKQRILEFLAVLALRRDLKGPILCFVGPPGVGKTSLGRSIARATGREFVRLSLGGTHDEAEIRGHRRTYVGALPGQIIRGLRRAGTNNPVFMLDEVDKLGRDFRGDPADALLEVLDPEQNFSFRDHYLDVPFNLSKVLFITTANVLDPVPAALRDRMETLELPGYSDDEKLEIAERYLVPKQLEAHGLDRDKLRFTQEGILQAIRGYTHESGVRALERCIASICRKRARQVVEGRLDTLAVGAQEVRSLLGVECYRIETQLADRTRSPGVAVGLAWTPYGGEILFVEASRSPRDKGDFTITGHVGELMQESAKTALSWLRANAAACGIDPDSLRQYDIHLHVPAGAVPKDGPSAGVVIATALVSLFRNQPVRPYVVASGEITLSGLLLPVGGIKEKALAASRSGVREIIMPLQNEPNVLDEVPVKIREMIEFRFAGDMFEVLRHAFPSKP
jgi:ATP-dependent Lon protease